MIEQKQTTKKLAKSLNLKYKNGLSKIEDMYKYIDE